MLFLEESEIKIKNVAAFLLENKTTTLKTRLRSQFVIDRNLDDAMSNVVMPKHRISLILCILFRYVSATHGISPFKIIM
jgi:hypothetical protein